MSELLRAAHTVADAVTADRRAIHRQPELAYNEHETSDLVARRLRDLGIPIQTGVGGTGIIGLIEGSRPGRTVLLRADMDALPIEEEAGVAFASANAGVMHACGHDAHTAILLGATRLLLDRRKDFAGAVKLMFQPAEEGGAGAMRMIDEGLLEDPKVDAAFMLHVSHADPAGSVGVAPGPALAGADSFTVTIEGRGGHASRPQHAIDPIVAAAQIVTALQTLVSREVPPGEPAVLTLGRIAAGTTHNVIPDRAIIQGTIRAYDNELMQMLEQRLQDTVRGVAAALRTRAMINFEMRYPPTINDAAMAELFQGAASAALGAEAVHGASPQMAAEDFSFVLQRVPGAMLRLGVRSPGWSEPRPVHTPRFELDEAALPVGVAAMTSVALEYLATS